MEDERKTLTQRTQREREEKEENPFKGIHRGSKLCHPDPGGSGRVEGPCVASSRNAGSLDSTSCRCARLRSARDGSSQDEQNLNAEDAEGREEKEENSSVKPNSLGSNVGLALHLHVTQGPSTPLRLAALDFVPLGMTVLRTSKTLTQRTQREQRKRTKIFL